VIETKNRPAVIKSLSANKAHTSCGHIFRHTASIFLVGRQPACENSPCLAKNLSHNPHTPYSRIGSKNISANAICQSDKAELAMDWSSFMVPVFQSVGGTSVTTSKIARPFMIGANGLNPVFVEFANSDTQVVDRLSKIYEKLILESKQISNMNTPFERAKVQLQAIPE